jgi:hypothetical protein
LEEESFEDEDTARVLNENFVNIKMNEASRHRPDLPGGAADADAAHRRLAADDVPRA